MNACSCKGDEHDPECPYREIERLQEDLRDANRVAEGATSALSGAEEKIDALKDDLAMWEASYAAWEREKSGDAGEIVAQHDYYAWIRDRVREASGIAERAAATIREIDPGRAVPFEAQLAAFRKGGPDADGEIVVCEEGYWGGGTQNFRLVQGGRTVRWPYWMRGKRVRVLIRSAPDRGSGT